MSNNNIHYSKCDPCIRKKECGFCFDKDKPTTTGSCLPVYKDHPERYADPNFGNATLGTNITFRCDKKNYDNDMDQYSWADSFCPTDYSWMAVAGLALFVIGFAPGKVCARSKYVCFLHS